MTTKFASRIVVLFVIAFFAMSLAACSSSDFSVSAKGDGSANAATVRMSERVDGCDFSSKQLLLNAAESATNPETGKIEGETLDQWLDSQMVIFSCIAPITN